MPRATSEVREAPETIGRVHCYGGGQMGEGHYMPTGNRVSAGMSVASADS